MKTAGITACVMSLALGAITVFAGRVTVTNVTAVLRPASSIVDIYYDLLNPSGGVHTVTIYASTNSGATYLANSTNVTGAVGTGVTIGTHKQVVWFAARDLPDILTTKARVLVTATDLRADANDMIAIPAGTFTMGDTFSEGSGSELPTHRVSVSAFSMDKYEVSKAKWDAVHTWATNHGYAFDYPAAGKATNHPVYMIDWYNCVQWCNARSEKEGKTPCYYTSAAKDTVYRTWDADIQNGWVDWTANGYRLPTEAEWEFAARGGTPGHRFPWSDANTITNSRANYNSYPPLYAFDLGPQGYNPAFVDGTPPWTSPVGYFAPNGYGLCDMAGNVKEWCWDWYDANWYSNAGARQNDPRGPATGGSRVLRGGSWDNDNYAGSCRVASRDNYPPSYGADDYGFRCVCAIAAPVTYSISGSVTGATQSGVTINLTGSAAASTTTAAGGGYSFSGLANGNYTVTPSKSGYTFSPTNRSVTISGANQTGKDFAATQSSGGTNMVLIPAGTFTMGQTGIATPTHSVTLTAFYMDKYETTYALWKTVYQWATNNGYAFDNAGSFYNNPTNPVHTFNWYDCVKWCNARSQKEGLTPCYYTDAAQTSVYKKINQLNLSTNSVKWTANGYRLPTEAEWEYAAHGGTTNTYPWGETITATNANYEYNVGTTKVVGSYPPNGYGLYDMSGNVFELNWDWYGLYTADPQTNPVGPVTGTSRGMRGGCYSGFSDYCRVADRDDIDPTAAYYVTGFRCVRR